MKHKLPRPVIAIVVLADRCRSFILDLPILTGNGNGELTASGSIEATMVNISPELAGKILSSGC